MKNKIKILALAISAIALSHAAMAQTVPFDNLNANCNAIAGYTGKSIIWNTSPYGNGFGHRIYNDDYNGKTYLKFAARDNSATWTDAMTITSLGNVGIGTDNPGAKLELFDASANLVLLKLRNNNWACDQRTSIEFWNGANKNFATSRIVSQMDGCGSDGEALVFETQTAGATSATPKMTIHANGNVGIGTTEGTFRLSVAGQTKIGTKAPTGTHADAMLAVDGKMVAKSMYVTQQNWADFVFDKDYNMPTLYEIETYYKANGHLPLIPSAAEVKENGVDLGEMNKLLLQKVEELTILMVEQEKRINALENNK